MLLFSVLRKEPKAHLEDRQIILSQTQLIQDDHLKAPTHRQEKLDLEITVQDLMIN